MKFLRGYMIILSILLLSRISICQESPTKLLMAKVMFRHGKQPPPTPVMFNQYLNTINSTVIYILNYEPFIVDGLTEEGKWEMYHLGAKMAKRYSELFNNETSKKSQILVQSTNHSGSQWSAAMVSAGILGEPRNDALRMKKPPKNITNFKLDKSLTFFYKNDTCKKVLNDIRDTVEYTKFTRELYAASSRITMGLKTHMHYMHDWHFWKIHDYYKDQQNSGVMLPVWMTEDHLFDLETLFDTYFKYAYKKLEVKKYTAGIYIEQILKLFKKAMGQKKGKTGKDLQPLQLISVQDTIMPGVVAAFIDPYNNHNKNNHVHTICSDRFEIRGSRHGDAIIAELHQDTKTNEYKVKVFYWDYKQDEPEELLYKSCKGTCSFEKFETMFKDIRISATDLSKCKQK